MTLNEEKTQDASAQQDPPKEPQKEKPMNKSKALQVGKYEVSDGKVKFFAAKGFLRKKWVIVREIPVPEIEHIESEGNQLSLTVKGTTEWFNAKYGTETFSTFAEQVNAQPIEQTTPQQENPQPPQPQTENPQPQIEAQQPQLETPPTQQEPAQPQPETPQLQVETQQPLQEPAQIPQEQPPPQKLQPQPEPQPEPQISHPEESQPQQAPQPAPQEPEKTPEKPKSKRKTKSVAVGKFEVSDGKIRFSATKGFFRKKWVVIREIPMAEVEKAEGEGNRLTLTSQSNVEMFHLKEKSGSFKTLIDQVNSVLEEKRKIQEKQTAEINMKNAMRRTELLTVINKSVDVVDLTFNLLIALQDKRINWQEIEAYAGGFSEKLDFVGQTLPPFKLDYSKISATAKTKMPRDASKEAFSILKAAYGYFGDLKLEDDIKDNPPNFQTAKTLVNAYYLLNDLLLGRFVGDKDNRREVIELEAALQNLAAANFKVDVEALKGSLDLEAEKQAVIEDSRALFKEQLKQL
jgi:hypothetical protein